MKHNTLATLAILCLTLFSCDYLNVVPKGSPGMEDLFRTHTQANKYACALYSHVYQPNKFDINASMELCGGGDLISGARADRRYFNWKSLLFDNIETPSQTYFAAWIASGSPTGSHTYKVWEGIRNAYILLEHIDEVPDATEEERNQWRGDAYWIIAYYHQIMLEYYGPLILADHLISMNEDMQVARVPYLDCVRFISDTYDKAAGYLPATQSNDYYGRATSVLAKALKARLWLYAASPLINGNAWYAGFTNTDGTPLIPQKHDPELWKKAMDAADDAIRTAEENGYGLYESSTDPDDFTRGYENYRTAFIGPEGASTFYNNTENLFSEYSTETHLEYFAPRTTSGGPLPAIPRRVPRAISSRPSRPCRPSCRRTGCRWTWTRRRRDSTCTPSRRATARCCSTGTANRVSMPPSASTGAIMNSTVCASRCIAAGARPSRTTASSTTNTRPARAISSKSGFPGPMPTIPPPRPLRQAATRWRSSAWPNFT